MRDLIPFLKLYRKHWFGLTLGMLLALLTMAASIGLLSLSGWFLSAAAVAGLTIARETFNYMLPGAFVRGFAMGRTAGRWGERVVSHNATFKLLADLRLYFYRKLVPLIPSTSNSLRDADLLNRITADVDSMDHVYLRLVSPMIVGVLGTIGVSALVAWFAPGIGLMLAAVLLSLLLIWPVLFYKLGKRNGASLTEHRADLRIRTLDWIQGYSELTLFGAEARYRERIHEAQTNLLKNQWVNAHITGLAQALLLLANGWTLVFILWFAADGIAGQAPDPIVALIAFATMASFELLMPIAGAFQHLGQTLTSARRLNEILQTKPEVQFVDDNQKADENHDRPLSSAIQIDNVTYQYPIHDNSNLEPSLTRPALDSLTLNIEAGEKVAILGKTGCGKSTLLQLLCRFWDSTQGTIKIDEREIKTYSESELRAAITVVSQRVDILNGSLRDNLQLSQEHPDQELETVLQQVGLEELLLAPGLDTWLGEGGRQLSGGEKRRIGIARAMLKPAPIVLLDEPTEGLDKQTEAEMLGLFDQYFSSSTVLFVTHRLVNLHKMDKICLLDNGKLIETGRHDDLLAADGHYAKLNQALRST